MSSTVTRTSLTPAQIAELMGSSGNRKRSYKPTIITFVKSGDLSIDFMSLPDFASKKVDAVYQSVNNNLKILRLENPEWPTLALNKIPGDGTSSNPAMVLLVNMDLLTGALTSE